MARHAMRPNNVVPLEVRSLLSTCVPSGPVPEALTSCRNWITYSPSRPFNPNQGVFPDEARIRADLQQLYNEGWRGLVTYSLDSTLASIPRIAKQVGFSKVIAGLFWFDEAQLAREKQAALSQVSFIDAYVVGNEGLFFNRYTRTRLEAEITSLRTATGRPTTTTETEFQYRNDPTLLNVGDWAFPTFQTWFPPASIRDPAQAVASVLSNYQELVRLAPTRTIVVKESWWPTDGHLYGEPAATEANQVAFFRGLAATPVRFVWGEAYDQFWKTDEGPQGPHWGFHRSTGEPKAIIAALTDIYRLPYVPRPGSLQLNAVSYALAEGGGAATIVVTRTGGDDGTVSVLFATADGTATAPADYAANTGQTLTFRDGETSKTIAIPIVNDALVEGSETVIFSLSTPGGGATLGAISSAVLTIVDDDATVDPSAVADLPVVADYSGDGRADLATYRSSTAEWTIRDSASGLATVIPFGWAGVDLPVPARYGGGTKAQVAVYRPTTGQWFLRADDGSVRVVPFGWAGHDVPVPGDYDGDGTSDVAVYRPETAQWFVRRSTDGGVPITPFGWAGVDQPVPADYDGDRKADLAVFRPTTAEWFVRRSTDSGTVVTPFGQAGRDLPRPGDYDGDGKSDVAVYRPATASWFVRRSSGGDGFTPFGLVGVDQPVPADYDGNRKADLAVSRPTTAEWFVRRSTDSGTVVTPFGRGGTATTVLSTFGKHLNLPKIWYDYRAPAPAGRSASGQPTSRRAVVKLRPAESLPGLPSLLAAGIADASRWP